MNKEIAGSVCGGCPIGCHQRLDTNVPPAPKPLTSIVALLYGVPLVVLAAAVTTLQALQVGPILALFSIGAVLALSLTLMTRYGLALERLLATTQALQRTSK